MKKPALRMLAFAAALVATSAFAQYADNPLLRGRSWGPDAQIFAGSSVSDSTRDRPTTRASTERTQGAASGTSARENSPARQARAPTAMDDFFRWNDFGALNSSAR